MDQLTNIDYHFTVIPSQFGTVNWNFFCQQKQKFHTPNHPCIRLILLMLPKLDHNWCESEPTATQAEFTIAGMKAALRHILFPVGFHLHYGRSLQAMSEHCGEQRNRKPWNLTWYQGADVSSFDAQKCPPECSDKNVFVLAVSSCPGSPY